MPTARTPGRDGRARSALFAAATPRATADAPRIRAERRLAADPARMRYLHAIALYPLTLMRPSHTRNPHLRTGSFVFSAVSVVELTPCRPSPHGKRPAVGRGRITTHAERTQTDRPLPADAGAGGTGAEGRTPRAAGAAPTGRSRDNTVTGQHGHRTTSCDSPPGQRDETAVRDALTRRPYGMTTTGRCARRASRPATEPKIRPTIPWVEPTTIASAEYSRPTSSSSWQMSPPRSTSTHGTSER